MFSYSTRLLLIGCVYQIGFLSLASIRCMAQFDTVIDLPPDIIGDRQRIGSNTQVNVAEGGLIGVGFEAGSPDVVNANIEVNVSGGTVGSQFSAYEGSEVTVGGGFVHEELRTFGARLTVFGGIVGGQAIASNASEVILAGGSMGDVSIADGSHFSMFAGSVGGNLAVENASEAMIVEGEIAKDVQLNTGSSLTFLGGTVRGHIGLNGGSKATVRGGTVDVHFELHDASEATISGGLVKGRVGVHDEGRLNMIGGRVGIVTLHGNSQVNLAGGTIRDSFHAYDGGTVHLSGVEIRNDFSAIGSYVTIGSDAAIGGRFRASAASEVSIDGGNIGNGFSVSENSFVSMTDGIVGNNASVDDGSRVTMSGGVVGDHIQISDGSQVTISGGVVGSRIQVSNGSQITISGGELSRQARVRRNSQVMITGGEIGTDFGVVSGSRAFLAGGMIGARFGLDDGTELHLFGTEFFLDGEPVLASLGERILVDQRGVPLGGTLVDGSTFEFDVASDENGVDFFSDQATLTITLVSSLSGDYNGNGTVDQGDLDLVLSHWGDELFHPYADGWINDLPVGAVDQEELDKALLGWGTSVDAVGSVAIAEPRSIWLCAVIVASIVARKWHGRRLRIIGSLRPKETTMAGRREFGFTLVELLVVMTIIGVLAALLLPAIQSAREAARRVQCKNNLKQLALAALAHEEQIGHFPTCGWTEDWVGDADRGFGRDQPGGWAFNVLPFLEVSSLRDLTSDGNASAISENQKQGARKLAESPIAIINCPSRRPTGMYPLRLTNRGPPVNGNMPESVGKLDYAINGGDTGPLGLPNGPRSLEQLSRALWPYDSLGNPFDSESSNDESVLTAVRGPNGISFQRSEVAGRHVVDGMSSTYLIGEKAVHSTLYASTDIARAGDRASWIHGIHHSNCRYGGPRRPVRDRPHDIGFNDARYFGSAHPSSLHMAYCDGSVRAISYEIDQRLHLAAANRKDGTVQGASENASAIID